MKNLKKLGVAAVLTLMLSLSVFAGEMLTPPCAPPEPGEMLTPPCVTQVASDDPTTSGQLETPPASNAVEMLTVAEAMNVLQSMLTFF
ncbi:MAG TPA: hypothetical protein VK582_15955 [Pyrinomonadaceae bacterium]|nr:hypothetical protein [Pyrinomonadaceae bacterium]